MGYPSYGNSSSPFIRNLRYKMEYLCKQITFFKDFECDKASLNVGIDGVARGSPTATYTADRTGATTSSGTYIDSNGVIQSMAATDDTPRFAQGYYDATGFHSAKGLMIEAAATNLCIRTDGTASGSGLWTGWSSVETGIAGTAVKSNVAIPELTSISGAKSQRMQYTGVATDSDDYLYFDGTSTGAASVANTNTVTLSCYMRSQTGNSGTAQIILVMKMRNNLDALLGTFKSSAITLTSSWRKYTLTATMNNAGCDRVRASIGVFGGADGVGVDDGDVIDYEVYGVQIEVAPYPTSFIPTTTAALTRNAELLKYAIAGNRTAATESIAIKFMPLGGSFANDGVVRNVIDTDTKRRVLQKFISDGYLHWFPNSTDSIGSTAISTTEPLLNTSYIAVVVSYGATAGTNAEIYLAGTSENTSTTNYTAPAWGTYFYMGSSNAPDKYLNGLIQKVAIFSRALTAPEVASVSSLLGS